MEMKQSVRQEMVAIVELKAIVMQLEATIKSIKKMITEIEIIHETVNSKQEG